MNIERYNIIWRSQSKNSSENMPCGGCDVGVAAWVEGGELLFYIDRSGSFDENNQMLKLGRVRVSCSPNPFAAPDCDFRQTLELEKGRIVVEGRAPGLPAVTYTLWCRSDAPAVHLEVESDTPVEVTAVYESWRFEDRSVPPDRRMPLYSMQGYPGEVLTYADTVESGENGVFFFHQNRNGENCFEKVAELEGLGEHIWEMYNPQKDFIFGGVLRGEGFSPTGIEEGSYADVPFRGYGLRCQPARRHSLAVALHSGYYADAADYQADALAWGQEALATREQGQRNTEAYWSDFWNRSEISIYPGETRPEDTAWQAGRGYNLFRFLLGFNSRGDHPTKFNGGLLTTDPGWSVGEKYAAQTPDYRNWGGGSFTAQNQRLVYWPMLASGDWELMAPQFEFYRKALPNAEQRVKTYWGHEGAAFTEQMENFGLPVGCEWGWPNGNHMPEVYTHRPAHDQTEITGPWIRYLYAAQLEFCYMILQYGRFSGEDISAYKKLLHSCIVFFDRHYRMRHFMDTVRELDVDGKLVFYPSTALETYKDATNPADLIAALNAVLDEILEQPGHRELFAEHLEEYRALRETIPPLTFREVEGKRVISPAKSWSDIMNVELPQLYPVYPYGRFGLERPDLETAVNTYFAPAEAEGQRDYISWHQDNIFAARLGLAEEAKRFTFAKLADGPRRFPAYWGPGHDWVPDHNWGGSGMIGLQEMLLQQVDDKLLLFPAWPRELPVRFKLYAVGALVEAEMRDGEVKLLRIEPPKREKDILYPGQYTTGEELTNGSR